MFQCQTKTAMTSQVNRSPTDGRGARLVLEPIGSLERSGRLARWDFNSSLTVVTFSCLVWNSFKFFFASLKSFFCCQINAPSSSCSSCLSFSSLSKRLLYSLRTFEASSTFSARASAAALSESVQGCNYVIIIISSDVLYLQLHVYSVYAGSRQTFDLGEEIWVIYLRRKTGNLLTCGHVLSCRLVAVNCHHPL